MKDQAWLEVAETLEDLIATIREAVESDDPENGAWRLWNITLTKAEREAITILKRDPEKP